MGLGRSGKVLVGAINVKKICFVFCFLALFFLLFLFFSAPVNVVFLLLLFSAVLFVVLFRPFMCVCCYCCLVVFVFGRDKYNFLVLRFLSVLFLCCWFFSGQICMLLFLLCCFLHLVCCVVSAGFAFSLLFSLWCGCVWHCICNALVRCRLLRSFCFFFAFVPPDLVVVFLLLLPLPPLYVQNVVHPCPCEHSRAYFPCSPTSNSPTGCIQTIRGHR